MDIEELIETLEAQAREIADAGHAGWGNTMIAAAEMLKTAPRQQDASAALKQLDDIEAAMGGRNGPSVRLRAFIESIEKKLQTPECEWECDSDGNWETDCRETFVLNEGTPGDNRMAFCCYCGKSLKEAFSEAEMDTEE